jgi:hypothetical protein
MCYIISDIRRSHICPGAIHSITKSVQFVRLAYIFIPKINIITPVIYSIHVLTNAQRINIEGDIICILKK